MGNDSILPGRRLGRYKNIMDEMLAELDVLEKAIAQQEPAAITASINKVKDLQKKGHTLFK